MEENYIICHLNFRSLHSLLSGSVTNQEYVFIFGLPRRYCRQVRILLL